MQPPSGLGGGGIASLYRGFGTVLIGGTPGTMLYLCSYEIIKQNLSLWTHRKDNHDGDGGHSSFFIHFGAGMLAEAIACIVYVPVDVLKERMQVSNTYRNAWHGLGQIWKQEGISGVYRGYGATLASFGPFSAFYFLFYEECKSIMTRRQRQQEQVYSTSELPFSSIVLCSCSSGALASWLTSPLDMAKLRLQVQRASSTQDRTSTTTMVQILRQVLKNEGISGLFRGAGARVLHFAPATTITMTAYETCRSFYARIL